MRLFFALFPDALTRQRLSVAAGQLHLEGLARAVSPANFHVTVAFVGEVSDRNLRTFGDMGASFKLRRCVIELDSSEYWPKSQTIVLAARNHPRDLTAQTDALRAAVQAELGHSHETIGWRAHATLARKVAQAPVLTAMSSVAWVSQSFCLVRSTTGGDASAYTVVERWSLLDDVCDAKEISAK